jgi:hypothetical protein
MTIGTKDLHPSVGEVLLARAWSLRVGHMARPEDAGARRVIGKRWKGIGWRILAAVPIGAMFGAGVATLLGLPGEGVAGVAFMSAYFSGIGTGVGSLILGRFGRKTEITAEEIRALADGIELGRPQTIYLDTVCALLEAGGNVSDQTGRDILSTLNELLDQALYVNGRLDRLQTAASTESVLDLEQERARLAERAEKAEDSEARLDLNQSLAICDERLQNARALEPLIERMDAQREVIEQTMLSVQSSVSRLLVAPAAVAAPDVEEVKRVVSEVTAQTKAVEDAVQQVIALQG